MTRAMDDQVSNTLVELQNCLHKAAWRMVVNNVLSEQCVLRDIAGFMLRFVWVVFQCFITSSLFIKFPGIAMPQRD